MSEKNKDLQIEPISPGIHLVVPDDLAGLDRIVDDYFSSMVRQGNSREEIGEAWALAVEVTRNRLTNARAISQMVLQASQK